LGGLQRASAWGAGGANGPAATLAVMDREKSLQDRDTLEIQQTMAAMRAQQAARQRFAQNQGYGQPAAAAQPGAAAQPAAAARPGAAAQPGLQIPNYLSVIAKLPESMQASALTAIENGDEATWNAITQAAEKTRTPEFRNLEQLRRMEEGPYSELFKGQAFEKGLAPRTYVDEFGHDRRFSTPMSMPPGAGARAPAPAASGVDLRQVAINAGIPESAIISGYRDPAKQLSLIDREDPKNPGKFLTKEGRPGALPGQSAHQIPGAAIDIKTSYPITPAQEKALAAAGAVKVPGDPGHYQLPMSKINAELASNRDVAPRPRAGTSVQDVALQQKALEASIQSFMANDYKAITDRASEAKNIERLSDQVLANLEGNKFGPGTKLTQSLMEYAQIAGIPFNAKETQKFVDNMGIETARKFLSAAGARQAMGAQFTAVEANDWLKAFAGIDSPKQYLKNFYQVQRAGALVDQDVKDHLLRNKGREQEAYVEWQNSGRKDKIMQENVDSFKNGKLGKVDIPDAKPPAQKSAGPKANAAPIDYKDFNKKRDTQ
jgi:hypothetical protein